MCYVIDRRSLTTAIDDYRISVSVEACVDVITSPFVVRRKLLSHALEEIRWFCSLLVNLPFSRSKLKPADWARYSWNLEWSNDNTRFHNFIPNVDSSSLANLSSRRA